MKARPEGETGSAPVAPIMTLGLEVGKNDYVCGYGQWKPDGYLPAFVRRYPFVLANNTAENACALTICFDASFSGLGQQQGRALFNEDGSKSPFLHEVNQFVSDFRREMERTQAFVAELQKLDLLERKFADIRSPSGAFSGEGLPGGQRGEVRRPDRQAACGTAPSGLPWLDLCTSDVADQPPPGWSSCIWPAQ